MPNVRTASPRQRRSLYLFSLPVVASFWPGCERQMQQTLITHALPSQLCLSSPTPVPQTSGEGLETDAVKYQVWDANLVQGNYTTSFRCGRGGGGGGRGGAGGGGSPLAGAHQQ